VEFLDEFYAGVPTLGAPAIQHDFAASYQLTAWALFLVPMLLSLVVEPLIFLRADRWPRRWLVCGSVFAMAGSAWLAAWAPSIYVLAAAVSLSFVATGVATSLAEATLVDASPDNRERAMTRWTLVGWAGDLAAPALIAGLAAAAISWRGAYAIAGGVIALWALAMTRGRFPAPSTSPDEDSPGLLASLGTAVRAPGLLLWLFGLTLCDLLDEILVVFASLYLRDLGVGPVARSAALAAFVIGGIAGLVAIERWLDRIRPLRLLVLTGAACAVLYLAWIAAATTPWLSMILMAGVGATAAPLWPLASAQAYSALPGRSGAVQAVNHLFMPVALCLPWFLGWLADHAGPSAALVALTAEPIGLAVIALYWSRRGGRQQPDQISP